MTGIPERLRERAKEIVGAWYGQTDVHVRFEQGELLREAIATALHEERQAARAEGERAGIERAAALCSDASADARRAAVLASGEVAQRALYRAGVAEAHAEMIRALPTTAEPAKGA